MQTVARVAFAAAGLEQRLSDHLGIEAVVNLSFPSSETAVVGPLLETAPLRTAAADRAIYGGGE